MWLKGRWMEVSAHGQNSCLPGTFLKAAGLSIAVHHVLIYCFCASRREEACAIERGATSPQHAASDAQPCSHVALAISSAGDTSFASKLQARPVCVSLEAVFVGSLLVFYRSSKPNVAADTSLEHGRVMVSRLWQCCDRGRRSPHVGHARTYERTVSQKFQVFDLLGKDVFVLIHHFQHQFS
jgi:hypothetical protein